MPTMQVEDVSFITPEEAASYLRLDRTTVYRLIDSGEIPARRIGRQWRIPKAELDSMLETTKDAS